MRTRFGLSAMLALAAGLGGRLMNLAGLGQPRFERTPRDPRSFPQPGCVFDDSSVFLHANTAPDRGWWNEPQSEQSIAWHKHRAVMKRQSRGESWGASNYARNNCPQS